MDDDNESRREGDASGVHAMANNASRNTPRVIVGFFHRRYAVEPDDSANRIIGVLKGAGLRGDIELESL